LGARFKVAFFRTDVVEAVVEIFTGIDGVFLEQVAQVTFGTVVRRRQVLGKEDIDGQRFGERGDRPAASLGE
jgi:hypothetical protein